MACKGSINKDKNRLWRGVYVMDVKVVFKEAFSVIGKKAEGLAVEGEKWIPEVWEKANGNFNEIKSIIKYDQNGKLFGLWGLMSSHNENFEPWEERGLYLAGCEADTNTDAPKGWTKWTLPAQTYLVAACTMKSYGQAYTEVMKAFMPKHQLTLVGAIHEHYPEPGNSDCIELYFPVAKGNTIIRR